MTGGVQRPMQVGAGCARWQARAQRTGMRDSSEFALVFESPRWGLGHGRHAHQPVRYLLPPEPTGTWAANGQRDRCSGRARVGVGRRSGTRPGLFKMEGWTVALFEGRGGVAPFRQTGRPRQRPAIRLRTVNVSIGQTQIPSMAKHKAFFFVCQMQRFEGGLCVEHARGRGRAAASVQQLVRL